MKFEINEGEDAVCSYSGKQKSVVIRFEDLDGNQTGWFGSDILEKALRLMQLSSGVQQFTPMARPEIPQQYKTPYTEAPFVATIGPMAGDVHYDESHQKTVTNQTAPVQRRQATPRSPEEKHVVEGFASDLVGVIKKREKEEEPVTGKDLVNVVKRWKNSFKRIENALPILSAHMGKMDQDQFKNLVHRATLAEKYEKEEVEES